MRIEVNLGERTRGWLGSSRQIGYLFKPILSALVDVNLAYLKTHDVPNLYDSRVRYGREPPGVEEFASIPVILKRGWGDCDDLVGWRVAELRHHGEPAKIRIQWRKFSNNSRLFHVLVRRADGKIEDPSELLGMT